MQSYDVVIIGAGVIGCAIARALNRLNIRTLNIDKLPAAGYGSTSHSSAIIRSFYTHTTACAIAHEARERWIDWAQYLEVTGASTLAEYKETGGLVLVRDGEAQHYQQNLKAMQTVGVEYEIWTPSEIAANYPGICLDAFGPPRPASDPNFGHAVKGEITEGIYIPAAGYVNDPQLAARNLQESAAALGADFLFGVDAIAINSNTRITGIQTSDGQTINTACVINAAGPHSSVINELAGVSFEINTRPHRHEVAYLKRPRGYQDRAGFIVDLDAGVYQRPDGADMLIGSADPDCDPSEIVNPDDYNTSLTDHWTTQVQRAAQRWPELGIENTARGTVGIYDVSDDWIPIYDKTDLPGYFVAIGTSGNQFKNAPVVGELMAEIVQNQQHDTHPSTLQLPRIGRSVQLDFYSRRRTLRQTRSVMA